MNLHLPGVEPRPRVEPDLSNIDQVCDYYATHGPSATFMRGFHWVMGRLCSPYTVYAPEAQERIEEHLATGDPTILAMTHHSWFDPSNAAAAIEHEESLNPIIGKTIIPANLAYFNYPVFGPILAIGGAKPVYRKKDLARYYAGQGMSQGDIDALLENIGDARKDSNSRIRQVEVEMVDDGHIYASYVEGTRNRGDQSQLQRVQNGVRTLLGSMENADRTKLICIGYDYGGGRFMKRFLTPTMYVDMVDAPENPDDVNEVLTETLQGCIDGAIANRPDGVRLSSLSKAAIAFAGVGGVALERLVS